MMTRTASASVSAPIKRLALGRLWWAGPLTVVAAVAANALVRALIRISTEFAPLQWSQFIFLTVVGVTGAVLVFAVVGRFSRRPVRLFRIIAGIVLLHSFLPDFGLLSAKPHPGTDVLSVCTLVLMHVVAATVSVGLLERFTRAEG